MPPTNARSPARPAPPARPLGSAAQTAVAADRERRAAIMALPEAKGSCARLAAHFADNTDMTVEQVRVCCVKAREAPIVPEAREQVVYHADGWPMLESRLAGLGLGGQPSGSSTGRRSLADAMRETLGLKDKLQ